MNEKMKQILKDMAVATGVMTFVFTFVEMGFEWLTFAEFRALFMFAVVLATLLVTLVRNDLQ